MTVLTSTVINNAEIKEKIYYIWDDMVKGFALKVIPNGQKKYIIKYRTAMGGRSGVQRWYIFGDIQNLSCKEAREEAAKLFRMIHEGKDPQAEKASLREADTLTEFWELYVKDYASLKENKENYLKHTEPLWRLEEQFVNVVTKKQPDDINPEYLDFCQKYIKRKGLDVPEGPVVVTECHKIGYDENGRMTFEKVEMEDDTEIQEEPQENLRIWSYGFGIG